MVPVPLGEEQLQRPHGAARRHRNGLHALAPQVRQQSPTVNAKVTHHPAFAQTSPERANELRQRRTQPGDLLWRHRRPPCRWEVYREPPPQNLSFSCAVLLACPLRTQLAAGGGPFVPRLQVDNPMATGTSPPLSILGNRADAVPETGGVLLRVPAYLFH